MSALRFIYSEIVKFFNIDPFSYAAAISFYTILALPSLTVITINLLGLAFQEEDINNKLLQEIQKYIRPKSVESVEEIINNIQVVGPNTVAKVIGIATIVFSATSVFVTLQKALNAIFRISSEMVDKFSWWEYIKNRLISFGLVLGLGFIMIVSLTLDSLMLFLERNLINQFGDQVKSIIQYSNIFISLLITAFVFGLLFKFVPDTNIRFKDAFSGGVFTALLFVLGKIAIGLYIASANIEQAYGAASSFVLFVIWVYYSSFLLLLGAHFTKVLAIKNA